MFAALVQLGDLVQFTDLAVHPGADKSLGAQHIENLFMFPFATLDQRCQQHQFAALGQGQNMVYHLAHGLGIQWRIVVRTTWLASASKQQAQVIVYFGDGTDGRAWIVGRGLLLNGNGRGQTLNMINVRLFHDREKLACISREGLHITALTFGINRIESQ